jgi:glycoside/pentoside/hexuronide:cation symporter, GPH family
MSQPAETLSFREKVGYAVGDTASNLYFQTFLLFIPIFYTDVVGLSAGAVATMFLVSRIFDAVNDPAMGTIADRTVSRWGKYRPWLLFVAVPFGVAGFLAFSSPQLSATGKLVYAYVTYNLLMIAYTAINVPYAALMGVMTPNPLERTSLAAYRFVGVFTGGLIIQGAALWMVEYFGQGDQRAGWQWTMACISALAIALFWTTFATTRERVQPPPGQEGDLRRDLRSLLSRPWLLIGGATFFQLAFIAARGSTVAYYFKYYVGDQTLSLPGFTRELPFAAFASSFLVTGTLATIAGTMCSRWLAQRMGKGRAYATFLGVSVVAQALFFVARPSDVLLIYGLNLVGSFAWGPVSALQWAMYTDVADHMEWRGGRRATALVMAASLLMLKLGLAIGGAFVVWMLGVYGFEANVEQAPAVLDGIRMLMSVFPALFGTLGVVLMAFYPLGERVMAEVERDLNERRGR